jgi:hypothetical protein
MMRTGSDVTADLDEWKQGVSRATAYVQSNAAIQVQVFGFYISALGIAIALARPDIRDTVIFAFVPGSAFLLLTITAKYFAYISYQDVFISLYGTRFDPAAPYRCHDEFWADLKLEEITLQEAVFRTVTYWNGLPYFAIWWAYIAGPPVLMVLTAMASEDICTSRVVAASLLYMLISLAAFAVVSRIGWVAIVRCEKSRAAPE